MKIEHYEVCAPDSYSKSCHILGKDVDSNSHSPLIYFTRPKWIKDDKAWETIVKSVRIELPVGFEIK